MNEELGVANVGLWTDDAAADLLAEPRPNTVRFCHGSYHFRDRRCSFSAARNVLLLPNGSRVKVDDLEEIGLQLSEARAAN